MLLSLLNLPYLLQETDPVSRQTGTHLEYEPEWEAAFNTHIKLSPALTLVLDWCATDRHACIRSYRFVVRTITGFIPS